MEKVTGFGDFFLKNYLKNSKITYEFRTKSLQIYPFLKNRPSENIIIAYSLLPDDLAQKFDIKAPSINLRIKSLKQLTSLGWQIGLRFDPLIYNKNWKISYKELIRKILDEIDINYIHSVSFGSLRFPKQIFNKISNMYPGDELFSYNFEKRDNIFSYKEEIEKEIIIYCKNLIHKKVKKDVQIFSCTPY
jgi:spore photoproduct lyase